MAPTVDLSSCQGEICATVELAKDTLFYRGVLGELGQTQVELTPLYGDNDSARRDQGLILHAAPAATLVRLRGYGDCSFACHGNG